MKLLYIAPLVLLAAIEAAPLPGSESQFYTEGQIRKLTSRKAKNDFRKSKNKAIAYHNTWDKILTQQHNEKKALNAQINANQVAVKNYMQNQKQAENVQAVDDKNNAIAANNAAKDAAFDDAEFVSQSKNIDRCLKTVVRFNANSKNFNFASVAEARAEAGRVAGLGASYCHNDVPCADAAYADVCNSYVSQGVSWS